MLLRETYEKAEGIRQQGRLLDTVGAVLSSEHKAEFTRLVEEYRSAQIADEEAGNSEGNMGKGPAKSGKSKKEARGGIVLKIGFEQFGQDVKRAYERVVSEGQGKLEDFFKNMDLSPQQEDKVRKLTSNFAQAHIKTPATQNEKTMLFLDISAELNPEQRAKLLNYVKENP